MRNGAAAIVVVVGQSLAGFELIEAALTRAGHRVLTTTKRDEVAVLARSIRIDVLVGDRGDILSALEEEVRLVQPDVHVVRICEPDELRLAGGNGAAIARPVSLRELEALVRRAVREPTYRRARSCRRKRTNATAPAGSGSQNATIL
jgi:DNA-binding response OmpR family regulator